MLISLFFCCLVFTVLAEDLECNEEESCANSYQQHDDKIRCYGFKSCQNATLDAKGQAHFSGVLAGYNARLKLGYLDATTHTVDARGLFSYAFGDGSLGVYYVLVNYHVWVHHIFHMVVMNIIVKVKDHVLIH